MDATVPTIPPRRSPYGTILVLLATLPLLAALWWAPILPTQDGPKQLYSAHVRFHIDDPAFASAFAPAHPPTSVGFTLLHGLLETLFPWRIAYGLAWTIAVLVLPIAVWQLARAFSVRRAPLCLLGVAGAIHWAVHMGFANYVPSLGLGLLAVGLGIAANRWSLRRELAIYAVLAVTCLFHPVGAQFAAVGLFIYRALGTARGRIIRELGAMVIGCSPAAAVTVITNDTMSELLEKGILLRAAAQPLSLGERLANFGTVFLSGPLWRSLPVLGVAAVGLAAAIGGLSFTALLRTPRSVDRRVASLVVIVAVALALALSLPLHSASWEFMQPRFIPPAVFAALVLCPIERLARRPRAVVVGLFFACAVSSNLWVVQQHRRFAKQHEDAFSGLGFGGRKGRTLLPIVAREETGRTFQHDRSRPVPYASFIFNLGQIYAVDRDAVTPYSFSYLPNIHPIQYVGSNLRRVPRRDYGELFAPGADPASRERELVRLATFGVDFDDVLFYGSEEDAARLVALGYRPEIQRGGFMIAHLVGCPIEVRVDAGPALGTALLGWVPSDRVVHALELGVPGSRTFLVARGSCGPMWLRWAPADAGETSVCRGAEPTGELLIEAGVSAVRCEVVGVPTGARPPVAR